MFFVSTRNSKVIKKFKDAVLTPMAELQGGIFTPSFISPLDYNRLFQLSQMSYPDALAEITDIFAEGYIDKYDTIYIGHPIWWDNIPNVVIGFLRKYNWNGKTIYHFCTHEGSGVANSPKTLEISCKGAIIKPYFETRGYMCQDIDNFDIEGKIDSWLK